MGKLTLNKTSLNVFFSYLFALVLILECRSIWTTEVGSSSKFQLFLIALLALVTVGRLVTMPVSLKGFNVAILTSLVILAVCLLWISATGSGFIVPLIKMLVALVLLFLNYFATERDKRLNLLFYYKNILVVVAIVSLFFWLFGSIAHLIQPTGALLSSWTGTNTPAFKPNYYNLYFETQKIGFLGIALTRNTAIFTEAPMASLQFVIAFLIESLLNPQKRTSKLLILAITILSTMSTTGIVLLLAGLLYRLWSSNSFNVFFKMLKYLFQPIVLILAIFVAYYLLSGRLLTMSGFVRLDDFAVGIRTWLQRPILGYGYGNMDVLISNMDSWRSINRGFSNAPTLLLAHGGIVVFSLYLFPIVYGLSTTIKLANKDRFIFVLAITYLFTFTLVPYQYIIVLLFLSFMDISKFST